MPSIPVSSSCLGSSRRAVSTTVLLGREADLLTSIPLPQLLEVAYRGPASALLAMQISGPHGSCIVVEGVESCFESPGGRFEETAGFARSAKV